MRGVAVLFALMLVGCGCSSDETDSDFSLTPDLADDSLWIQDAPLKFQTKSTRGGGDEKAHVTVKITNTGSRPIRRAQIVCSLTDFSSAVVGSEAADVVVHSFEPGTSIEHTFVIALNGSMFVGAEYKVAKLDFDD